MHANILLIVVNMACMHPCDKSACSVPDSWLAKMETHGLNLHYGMKSLLDLRFANDLLVFATSRDDTIQLLEELVTFLGQVGSLTYSTICKQLHGLSEQSDRYLRTTRFLSKIAWHFLMHWRPTLRASLRATHSHTQVCNMDIHVPKRTACDPWKLFVVAMEGTCGLYTSGAKHHQGHRFTRPHQWQVSSIKAVVWGTVGSCSAWRTRWILIRRPHWRTFGDSKLKLSIWEILAREHADLECQCRFIKTCWPCALAVSVMLIYLLGHTFVQVCSNFIAGVSTGHLRLAVCFSSAAHRRPYNWHYAWGEAWCELDVMTDFNLRHMEDDASPRIGWGRWDRRSV